MLCLCNVPCGDGGRVFWFGGGMQEIWKSKTISDCFQKETKCSFFRGREG